MPQLLFVTGKGGVGKTTVAAALAQRLAERKRRTLIVEMAADRSLAGLFGATELATEPQPLDDYLSGVRLDPRALVEAYFKRLLRLPFLSRRLFASGTFRAVTAAAPGVTEFLILEHLLQWGEPGRFGRRAAFDAIVVDGPASGNAVRLLRTPRQLARLVPRGPLANAIGRLGDLLGDARRTQVALVTIADEMAINETLEARGALAELGLHLARPVLNRVWPQRFTAADATAIARLSAQADEPLLAAARLQLRARHEAATQRDRLRDAFGAAPVALHEVTHGGLDRAALGRVGKTLERELFGDG
ncbi:MAG: ArsA family ATPase [Candidatus Binatia bacterium]